MRMTFPCQGLLLVTLAISSALACAATGPEAGQCKSWPTDEGELINVLGKAAIEAARLSVMPAEANRTRLATLVTADATFELGAGDVGRPLGKGPAALSALVDNLQADRYRFDGLNYMSRKVDPCASHDVKVEFSSQSLSHRAEIKFRFVEGRIVEGKGWLLGTTFGAFP